MSKVKVTLDTIDKKQFESLVAIGLTNEELVQFFMINEFIMWNWIKKAYHTKSPLVVLKKIRVQSKADFLLKQRKLAEKNPTISIWLGKNYYDQTDEKEDARTLDDFEDLNPLAELLKDNENEESLISTPSEDEIKDVKEDGDINN